ncbi:MAG: hypothetical protein IJI41_00140 [Anaerolineaceae bacterium]|nr:hypothetical protein [Anaerolineaceae bacterium]
MAHSLAFFGAFNPPTRAHVDLAEIAMRQTGAGYVTFVPSKSTYILDFQKKDFAFSDEDRIGMLKQIAEKREWLHWTDIELKSETQPRTYETLCKLRDMGENPSLLLGADKLPELEHLWIHVPEIASEFGIVCMDRGTTSCEELIQSSPFLTSLNLRVVHVPNEYKSVSSTKIRELFTQLQQIKETLQPLLPPELSDLPARLLQKNDVVND